MATGAITSLGPRIDPKALGYAVEAFTRLEVEQASRSALFAVLAAIPDVIEAHIVASPDDILCRFAARDNDQLRRVVDTILAIRGYAGPWCGSR